MTWINAAWLKLLANRAVIAVEVDVEVTDRGVSSRTAAQATMLEWGMIRRVLEVRDCWIFVASPLQVVTLHKAALTPLQRSDLAVA